MAISLTSEVWPQLEEGEVVVEYLRKWQTGGIDECSVTNFADASGCSDCCYDSFFPAFPHVMSVFERQSPQVYKNLIQILGHRILTAAESLHDVSTELLHEYQIGMTRCRALLLNSLELDQSTSHDKKMLLAILAATFSEPDLGREISRIGEDE